MIRFPGKFFRVLATAGYSLGTVCLAIALALGFNVSPAYAGYDLYCPNTTSSGVYEIGFQAPNYNGSHIDISWGDGSPPDSYQPTAKDGTVSHTYAASGTYTVNATLFHANDEGGDGASTTCDATVTIIVVTDPATEIPPTEVPTEVPTDVPTEVPTEVPTDVPTAVPTDVPPTQVPPTDVPPTAVPTLPPPANTDSGSTVSQPAPEPILIPVTGVNLAGRGAMAQQGFFNLGLAFLGFGMVFHGLSMRSGKKEG